MIIHLKNSKEAKKIFEIYQEMDIHFEGEKNSIEVLFAWHMDYPTNIEFKQDYNFSNEKWISLNKFLKLKENGDLSLWDL